MAEQVRIGGVAKHRPRLGLALGGGSARGWAHLGVLRALEREGIHPDLICGCSIGAFVGAVTASGELPKLINWAESLKWQDVMGLLDLSFKGGLIKGARLMEFFERSFEDRGFDALDIPFSCVATDLETGHEVWLREGSVAQAVRASIAIPGLMTPVLREGRLLADGGLVNPVPVSLCRAMGADVVVAVDLGSDMMGRNLRRGMSAEEGGESWSRRLLGRLGFPNGGGSASVEQALPSVLSVVVSAITIMQVRIARSRLAGEPADLLLAPRIGQLGPLDYHRAAEAMSEGEAEVQRMLPALHHVLSGR
jgi:NTE family protein